MATGWRSGIVATSIVGALTAGLLAIGPVWAQSVTDLPVPTARIDAERHLPVELLQAVADRHARMVWGEDAVGGHYFPLTDRDGAVRAYVFNYAQNRENLPAVETIFATIRELRAEHGVSFSGHEGRDRLSPKFYADLERRLGRLGAVVVAASREDFPILSVHHSIHPYFLYADAAIMQARRILDQEKSTLHRVYYFGPHELYFGFETNSGKNVLINADSMRPETPEEVFERVTWPMLDPSLEELVKRAWSEYTEQGPGLIPADGVGITHTLTLIPYYKLIPIVDWTYWCVPTAMTMLAGFWDNYVQGTGTIGGYGRIIDFWLVNSQSNNVPNFIDEIIDPSTGTWSPQGFLGTLNNTNGYTFSWTQTEQGAANDWAWGILKGEVDAGRPLMWSFPHVHSVTAFGYRTSGSQKFAVVYSTWGTTAQQQYDEYNYNQVLGGGATIATMNAGQLLPGGSSGTHNHSALIGPDGGEVVFGPTPVAWYSWGNTIKTTDLEASYDSGATWAAFATAVPTTPGWNTRMWTPAQQSRTTRVRLRSLDATGALVSADGSHTDISVSLTAELEPMNPRPTLGLLGFCDRGADGKLAIHVRNRGTLTAPASQSRVTFLPSGTSVSHGLPQIQPGGTAVYTVDIPGMCFNPDCDFKIEVDIGGTVPEADETNNSVVAWCIS